MAQSTANAVVLWGVVFVCVVAGFMVGGGTAVGFCARACCTLALQLPEMVCGTPLDTTVCSLGIIEAPPVPPARPSSWLSSWFNSATGTGAGAEGEAPAPATVTA